MTTEDRTSADLHARDMGGSAEIVSYELTIEAPPAAVFTLMTEADGLLQWIATAAEADPTPGGIIRWTHENGQSVEGRFVELSPPNRFVFTYGWLDNPAVGPASTVVEVTLADVDQDTTHLTLVHRHLPEAERENHRFGWEHFLTALAHRLRP